MKLIKLSFVILGMILFTPNAQSQTSSNGDWCGTDYKDAEMKIENPALIQQEEALWKQVRTYIDNHPRNGSGVESSPYIIPLVFHCITDGGSGWIDKSTIEDAVLTLNEDFNRTNADAASTRSQFRGVAGSTNIQFRLAHKDPNGNCTQGIIRKDSPLSTDATDAVKAVSRWNPNDYFNIWVVKNIKSSKPGTITAGYAYKPNVGVTRNIYGVIVAYDRVGRFSRTITHEVGHSFGLSHTFNGACGNQCQNSGDRICDTPPSIAATFGCSTTQNTCSNDASGALSAYSTNELDMIENYMSYDDCQNMFTKEQIALMEFYLNSSNSSSGLSRLTNSSNWNQTGVNDPYAAVNCAPIADFTYDKEFICEGGSVSFADDSYDGTPNAWNWTFTGGTPNTSPLPTPSITYNTPGVYSVTYQPSSTGGAGNSITKKSIITVSSLTADHVGPIKEGFETSTSFANDWYVINVNGGGFSYERTNLAAYTGLFSVRIRNLLNDNNGVHELISPSYDLSSATSKTLKFKQAFARKDATNDDKLLMFYSKDCGASWRLLFPLFTTTVLTTVSDNVSEFTPSSTNDWQEITVDLTAIGSEKNVRFKFQFNEGGGNNLYLDDINIGNSGVGIDDFSSIASFNVYPNPTKSSAQISFNLLKNVKNLSIKVRNTVGQEVTNVINGESFNSGKYTLKLDEQRKLSSGIYFVEFNADNNMKIQKLIVQ